MTNQSYGLIVAWVGLVIMAFGLGQMYPIENGIIIFYIGLLVWLLGKIVFYDRQRN